MSDAQIAGLPPGEWVERRREDLTWERVRKTQVHVLHVEVPGATPATLAVAVCGGLLRMAWRLHDHLDRQDVHLPYGCTIKQIRVVAGVATVMATFPRYRLRMLKVRGCQSAERAAGTPPPRDP